MASPPKFYSPDAVGLATFFGTPVAGGILLAFNFNTLGEPQKAGLAIGLSVAATAALILTAFLIPIGALSTPLAIGGVFAMRQIAIATQGRRISGLHSNWKAFGIAVATLVVVLGIVFATVLTLEKPHGTRFAVSPTEEIYYSGASTEADARLLADELKTLGFFDNSKAKSVMLSKKEGTVTVGFVTNAKAWQDEKMITAFTVIGSVLAGKLGKPLRVELLNTEVEVQHTIQIP